MKRILLAVSLAALAMNPSPVIRTVEPTISPQVKRRKVNKTANKINVFYGYPSDRKGKGQKAREASIRKGKGWK